MQVCITLNPIDDLVTLLMLGPALVYFYRRNDAPATTTMILAVLLVRAGFWARYLLDSVWI